MARMLLKSRPTGMTFKAYKAMCKASGSEAMDEGEFNKLPEHDEPDGDEGKGGAGDGDGDEAEKSVKNVNDLLKSLDAFSDVEAAMSGTGASRESYLTGRVQAGTITKSERDELAQIWSGGNANRDNVRKSLAEQIEDGEDGENARRMMDVSPFLKSLAESVDASLDRIGANVAEDGRQTRTLLKAQGALLKGMGRVIADQDALIKSLSDDNAEIRKRLGIVERTPAVRKSQGVDPRDVRPRDLGGKGGGGEGALTKSEVGRALQDLVKSADAKGDALAVNQLADAAALFEATGRMKPNVEAAVRAHLGKPAA